MYFSENPHLREMEEMMCKIPNFRTRGQGSTVLRSEMNICIQEQPPPNSYINMQEYIEAAKEQREPVVFKDMYPHAIRHTFCSRCFDSEMQPKVVQSIMGHQHYSTTIDIYTHISEAKYEEEIGKFGMAMEENSISDDTEMIDDVGQDEEYGLGMGM